MESVPEIVWVMTLQQIAKIHGPMNEEFLLCSCQKQWVCLTSTPLRICFSLELHPNLLLFVLPLLHKQCPCRCPSACQMHIIALSYPLEAWVCTHPHQPFLHLQFWPRNYKKRYSWMVELLHIKEHRLMEMEVESRCWESFLEILGHTLMQAASGLGSRSRIQWTHFLVLVLFGFRSIIENFAASIQSLWVVLRTVYVYLGFFSTYIRGMKRLYTEIVISSVPMSGSRFLRRFIV